MPTVLYYLGWRFYFYSQEGNEPIHIHVEKAEKICKFWIDVKNMDLFVASSYMMSAGDIKETKKIIYQHFDLIVNAWKEFQRKK